MDRDTLTSVAILALRVAVGVIFIAHGMQKLFGSFGGSGVAGLAGSLEKMGFSPSLFWAWVVAVSEAAGGVFILFGFLPRVSAGLIAVIMAVAIAKVHGSKGFFMSQGGFEYQFLILMACFALILTGAGRFSLLDKF